MLNTTSSLTLCLPANFDTKTTASSGHEENFRVGPVGWQNASDTKFVFCRWERRILRWVHRLKWGCSIVRERHPNLIVPIGTQIVTRVEVVPSGGGTPLPKGIVGELIKTPADSTHAYRVRFPDGAEGNLRRHEFSLLKHVKTGPLGDRDRVLKEFDLYEFVIYRCIVGSHAYGLSHEESDVDRRGIYLPPADLQWSLYGVPEQLENPESEEVYWELQKFLVLALKANPNVLECLYTPLVETKTELASALLNMREAFLSRLVYQTYNGYVLSQFKKLEQDWRTVGEIKWKHAMHLIRLLLSGITVLREGVVPLSVEEHRDKLLAIRGGDIAWDEVNAWRLELHKCFNQAARGPSCPRLPTISELTSFWYGPEGAWCDDVLSSSSGESSRIQSSVSTDFRDRQWCASVRLRFAGL